MHAMRVNSGTADEKVIARVSASTFLNAGPLLGSIRFVRLFEPLYYLRCSNRPLRQMRIERAGSDVWRVEQFRSREFLSLSLVRECLGRPCGRSLSLREFK